MLDNMGVGCHVIFGFSHLPDSTQLLDISDICTHRYDRADELVWIKTNQLQRLIRTGRTGHWLNHSKEHCLVGIKGDLEGLNWGMDCDVLVGEVSMYSRKHTAAVQALMVDFSYVVSGA